MNFISIKKKKKTKARPHAGFHASALASNKKIYSGVWWEAGQCPSEGKELPGIHLRSCGRMRLPSPQPCVREGSWPLGCGEGASRGPAPRSHSETDVSGWRGEQSHHIDQVLTLVTQAGGETGPEDHFVHEPTE